MKKPLVEQGLFMNVDRNRSEILHSLSAKKAGASPAF